MDDPNKNRGPWCSVCSGERRAGNHWFLVHATEEVFSAAAIDAREIDGAPVCGEACATKRFSEWLGERLKEAVRRRDGQADGVK